MKTEKAIDNDYVRAMLKLIDTFILYPSLETFRALMDLRRASLSLESKLWCWTVSNDHCTACRSSTMLRRYDSVCMLRSDRAENFQSLWEENQGEIVIAMVRFREFILQIFPDIAEDLATK